MGKTRVCDHSTNVLLMMLVESTCLGSGVEQKYAILSRIYRKLLFTIKLSVSYSLASLISINKEGYKFNRNYVYKTPDLVFL
jgi:hypothetical protein